MTALVFRCPHSDQEIDPGIEGVETDQSGGVRFVALHVRCPHCGEHHEIKIDEALVNEAA